MAKIYHNSKRCRCSIFVRRRTYVFQLIQSTAKCEDAQRKSDKLMKEARERAETNFYQGLNVRMDAFGEQYRQNLANQTQPN